MKIISKNPKCFTVTLKEIEENKNILSPRYYIEIVMHRVLNEWFSRLSLIHKKKLEVYHKCLVDMENVEEYEEKERNKK